MSGSNRSPPAKSASPATPIASSAAVPLGGQHRRARGWMIPLVFALAALVSAIAIGQRLWGNLRTSLARADLVLESARKRQQEMVEQIGQAQTLLKQERERLQTLERRLRAREAELQPAHGDLGRPAPWPGPELQPQAQGLARATDQAIAGLAAPGGLDTAGQVLERIGRWSRQLPAADNPHLGAALGVAQDRLTAARAGEPRQLAQRLQTLIPGSAVLPPGRPGAVSRLISLLQTAELALTRGDRARALRSLDGAAAWVAARFDLRNPEVAAFAREIATVRSLALRDDRSDLRTALMRVRETLAPSIGRDASPHGVPLQPGRD